MVSCRGRAPNFEFDPDEIKEAVKNKRLLSMEIELSLRCNFKCNYCYLPPDFSFENELTVEEIREVILQAKDLGAKRIIILGGEPMVYASILPIIRFIKSQGLDIEMFTNGFQITDDVAAQLFENKVKVVLKMNSFKEDIQDLLAGKKGAFKIIQQAMHNLKKSGYPSENSYLAVSTIICRQNIDELVWMWQWLRDQNIVPYFEMITPQGNARENKWLEVDSAQVYNIFKQIAEIDQKNYDQVWEPQPPLVGNKCLRHQFSCLVTSQGYVMPCVGVTIPVGNIREQRLANILHDSEVIQNLRNFLHTIKGPCHTCDKSEKCYGCRGAAYQLTGDYLASDPLCWENIERQEEILTLPLSVEELIPQKSPMRVIDSLTKIGEGTADISVTISADMPFIEEDGSIDEALYLEMIAQAIAAQNGFKQIGMSESASEGFLLGAKNFEVLGKARVGDTLKVSVNKYAQYGNFAIVKGQVTHQGDTLAQGEIKVWIKAY